LYSWDEVVCSDGCEGKKNLGSMMERRKGFLVFRFRVGASLIKFAAPVGVRIDGAQTTDHQKATIFIILQKHSTLIK
jgi:hypothetical protein